MKVNGKPNPDDSKDQTKMARTFAGGFHKPQSNSKEDLLFGSDREKDFVDFGKYR